MRTEYESKYSVIEMNSGRQLIRLPITFMLLNHFSFVKNTPLYFRWEVMILNEKIANRKGKLDLRELNWGGVVLSVRYQTLFPRYRPSKSPSISTVQKIQERLFKNLFV